MGDGYVIPPRWRARGSCFGTEELVLALVRAARAVSREAPGAQLGVADLSPRGGGPTLHHRSHENGRDVDLIYYAVDAAGRPLRPADAMIPYGDDGASRPYPAAAIADGPPAGGWEPTPRRFDVARNWVLVRALISDPQVEVQWIFMAEMLRAQLLAYAVDQGEPAELLERAAWVLHRPTDSQPHDDHMHVRVYCDAADRSFGCIDHGPVRWWKKHWKYMEPGWARWERQPLPAAIEALAMGPGRLFSAALFSAALRPLHP
jgi:penicillin-insensitive murein endopeptidase